MPCLQENMVKILLDSHILLWYGFNNADKFSKNALNMMQDLNNELYFSLASIWELTIKSLLNKPNFPKDIEKLRMGLLNDGILELPITAWHIHQLKTLPNIHKDPFDRLLLAQAKTKHMRFLTADQLILKYADDVLIDVTV